MDISGVKIQVAAVYQHSWAAGRTLAHAMPTYPRAQFQHHLWLVEDGVVEFETDDRHYQIGRNEACLLPFTLKRHIFTRQPAVWMSLHVIITVYNNFDLMRNLSLPAHWSMHSSDLEQMRSWMKIVVRDFRKQEPHTALKIQGLAHAIFGLSWPYITSNSLSASIHSDLPPWLSLVMSRIAQDPSCSIAALAHDSGFSQAQFRRLFHQYVGSAPRDYLTAKRLEKACTYLLQSDLSLREIASIIGWRDTAHFSKTFASTYGIPPSQYRQQRRNREAPETN